ncbi:GNAT family N-acetyltransferase [Neobacillus niacini]|uniref:GNAT family N-acetyltransferase n=1 Tax=Neobacillus niacini TaxID=86668 RepID=UPI0021CB4BEE|nr:GNAT family N-acetyltransferase [Neobacillus niacini]MCM3767642.1 GNAT family N-acetyltransferase [Neobacillus niacini]
MNILIREAKVDDLGAIREIYNQGIHDRIATLETDEKDTLYMKEWFEKHTGRYQVIVAEMDGKIVGWASLNQFNNRCAYDGVADISVYISRWQWKNYCKRLIACGYQSFFTITLHDRSCIPSLFELPYKHIVIC